MYYPELMDINKEYSLRQETVIKFDQWLGNRVWTKRRGLRASQFVTDCHSDPHHAQILMIYAAEKKILKKQYIFFCPFCTEFQRYSDISQIEDEKICRGNGETYNAAEYLHNIIIAFDIIKDPDKQGLVKS